MNISYEDHVINEEAQRKIQAAIGEYNELLDKKRELMWFGHISRSYDLAKTILQGTVKGKRRGWEDNIKNGQKWTASSRAVENRTIICGAPTTSQGHGIK